MKEVDTFATVAGEYFTKFTGGELGKNKTYQLLVKLDDFISAKKQLAEEKRKQISPGEEEKLVRFIDVTKECQRTYGKPGRITPLGGTAAGPDYHKKDQALVDWQRGLNSIFIMHSDSLGESRKKVLLKNIIQNIYDTEGKDNKYGIYPSGSDKKHINFNTTAGLKKFFEDYLFVDVKNASEKKALADSAYLHFHQLGLSNPVGTVVTSDDLQTATTKSLGEPTRWEEVYVPTADGVLCENCQEFSNLKIDMQLQAPTQGPYMDLRSKTKISWDKDVGIKHEILQGNILVKNERVKDYEFGMGFVKNYPDKKVMFNKLLQKRDELQVALEQENKDKEEKEKKSKGKVVAKKSDHKPKRGKIDALEVAIELFRHVDLSNREDLSAFQEKLKDISIGLNSTPESRQTSFSKIKAKVSGLGIMKKISPNTTTLLQELSEFISTQQQSLRNT
jgi:hypothetical protein